jgi:hypothetical protein
MRLWPKRVVAACATDRSLAIAHGLEDVFWHEVTEGKDAGKWKARAKLTTSIEEIIRERSSVAIQSALAALLDAPSPGNGGREPKAAGKKKSPRKEDEAGA